MGRKIRGISAWAAAALAWLWMGLGSVAAETPAAPPAAARTWDLKIGLSYLATMGNTETSSTGFDAATHQEWGLWAFDASAAAVRATRGEVDTAETQSWNHYVYAADSPMKYVDPNGLDPLPANLLQFFNAFFEAELFSCRHPGGRSRPSRDGGCWRGRRINPRWLHLLKSKRSI